MEECVICCNTYKKSVSCKLCDYKTCYTCFSKYIIDGTITPKCMNCEKPWTRKHLIESFGNYFVTHKYKHKRENVLFELEKSLLPETQPFAARVKKIAEYDKTIISLRNKQREIVCSINRLDVGILEEEFEEFLQNRKTLRIQYCIIDEDITNIILRKNRLMQMDTSIGKKNTVNKLMIKCPQEDCRGYVNTRNMKCGLCEIQLCKSCHEKFEDNHTCNQETVQTVKLLMNDTKNCPSCKSMIYKIEGCDQMFCTQCHTAFSWRTGEVFHGRIHNPHYYEFLRKNGGAVREVGDIPCGGLPSYRLIHKILGTNEHVRVDAIHALCTHIEVVELPYYNIDNIQGNLSLRIEYLNDGITLENFKRELQKREKATNKKREISTILNTFVIVSSDIFRRMIDDKTTSYIHEFDAIREFTNESLMDVSKVYTSCVVPVIGNDWTIKKERCM